MKPKPDKMAIFRTQMPLRTSMPTPALNAYLRGIVADSEDTPEKKLTILNNLKKQRNDCVCDRDIVSDPLQGHCRNSTSSQQVKQLVQYIRAALAKSKNELIRLLVPRKDISKICQALSSMERQGTVDRIWQINPLSGKKLGAQLISLVVFPPKWRNPAVPASIHMYSLDDEQEAREAMKAATNAGHYARMLRYSEWLADAMFYDPGQFGTRLDGVLTCGHPDYVVEVWEPAKYLLYCSVAYSQSELLDHIGRVYLSFNLERLIQETKRQIATDNNMDGSKQRRDEQRSLFKKLRVEYPQVKKDWLIHKICASHPRKPGWKIRTVKKNLKGLA